MHHIFFYSRPKNRAKKESWGVLCKKLGCKKWWCPVYWRFNVLFNQEEFFTIPGGTIPIWFSTPTKGHEHIFVATGNWTSHRDLDNFDSTILVSFLMKVHFLSALKNIFQNSSCLLGQILMQDPILTRRFPKRQIGSFWSLKSDCTKLRHRGMSWELEYLSNQTYSYNSKISKARISQILRFFDFESGSCETERLRNLKKRVKTSGHYLSS